jgi:XisI protein
METIVHPHQSLLSQCQIALEKVLTEYSQRLNLGPEIAVYLLVSEDRRHFMLMHEGWQGHQRLHGAIVHAEIRGDKIWLHYDGTEDGITDDLVADGIPKDHIVLAFHPPDVRAHTGYAIA